MPPKGLAMLIVGKDKGAPPEGSPEEEASEPASEASSEGDTEYTGVAGDILSAIKADDVDALATALQALCGIEQSKNSAG